MIMEPSIGETVVGVQNGPPVQLQTLGPHRLASGAEIKLSGIPQLAGPKAGSFYVNVKNENIIELYVDRLLKDAFVFTGPNWFYSDGGIILKPCSEDHAIVVGINHYPGLALPPLEGAERDAEAFAHWLLSADGGRLCQENINLIVPHQAFASTEEATPNFETVHSAFRKYAERVYDALNKRVGRRLYIFLSGHGILPTKTDSQVMKESALLMANAADADLRHFPGYAYANWFRNAGAYDEIVLFADCCRDQKSNVVPISPTFPHVLGDRDRVRVFYAAAAGTNAKARERDLGDPPRRRGIFSYALMQALENGFARDESGRVTATSLRLYLYNSVIAMREDQKPQIDSEVFPGEIVFATKLQHSAANVHISFSNNLIGKSFDLVGSNYPNADDAIIARERPVRRLLPIGLYKLACPGGPVRTFEVDGYGVKHVDL
jgi:uncharacterized caspase-like protein